jgi:hypothetical protein
MGGWKSEVDFSLIGKGCFCVGKKSFVVVLSILILYNILPVAYGNNAFTVGYNYNFMPVSGQEEFHLIDNHNGVVNISCSVKRFHDRIIEIIDDPKVEIITSKSFSLTELVDYKLSARKINDYYIRVTGVIQVRIPIDEGYYYRTIRVYKALY